MAYFELAHNWREVVMEAIRPEIRTKAENGLSAAKNTAPVKTGEYRDSLHLEETKGGYSLVAGTDHALEVEYGTRHQTGHRVLGRAADVIKRS